MAGTITIYKLELGWRPEMDRVPGENQTPAPAKEPHQGVTTLHYLYVSTESAGKQLIQRLKEEGTSRSCTTGAASGWSESHSRRALAAKN